MAKKKAQNKSPALRTEEQSKLFQLGPIVGFHGLAGEMKIRPTSNNPALALDVTSVQVHLPDGSILEAEVDSMRLFKNMIYLTLQGFEDRTACEHLCGGKVFTSFDELRDLEEDEWWTDDLIGLPVYTTEGELVGTVSAIIGANGELLEIVSKKDPEGEPLLVPFVKALVPVVDPKNRRIEVSPLPGLLD